MRPLETSPAGAAAHERVLAHAEVLRGDVRALGECAERLRAVQERLAANGLAPQWLGESVAAHLDACAVAAADLDAAAARLTAYAARLAREHRGRRT
ncbi:hypothetical protein [Spongiactinospora sp. 9N601]|uniref:hypothetical protein n=1 Tax=Spongiactinospora sp. 9N601 TaxID=3375149 RepID=UPI0037B51818